jgi:hypothetical protein
MSVFLPYLSSLQNAYMVLFVVCSLIFGKKRLDIKCVFWFSLQRLSEIFLIRKRIQRDIIVNSNMSSWKVLVILVRFNETLIFWADLRKILKYEISCKSVQWETSYFMRTDSHFKGNTWYNSTSRRLLCWCQYLRNNKVLLTESFVDLEV